MPPDIIFSLDDALQIAILQERSQQIALSLNTIFTRYGILDGYEILINTSGHWVGARKLDPKDPTVPLAFPHKA